MQMDSFWVPVDVSNPLLLNDIKQFFFPSKDDSEIQQLIDSNYDALNVICNRYEFVQKLQDLKKLLKNHTSFQNVKIENKNIEGKKIIEFAYDEKTEIEGVEFNGVQYDIDALCQYLLLTIIDKLSGSDNYEPFVQWLSWQPSQVSYTLEELKEYSKQYAEENGLRKKFLKVFSDLISEDLKNRLLNTFIIAKSGLGTINEEDLNAWNSFSNDEQLKKISIYLYDEIRCKYTHVCSRTLLNFKKISTHKPTHKKILMNKISPEKDNLISILQDVVKELVVLQFKEQN